MIQFIDPLNSTSLTIEGKGLTYHGQVVYPLVNGAYRLVSEENYTDSFGFQWNRFPKTQIDRFDKILAQSSERFWKETSWNAEELVGKNLLEVGSGAGRFTHVLLNETEANVYSIDYSSAVEANFQNNGPSKRLKLFQASIYELPFEPHQFDFVFCLGVLQHTPDFRKSINCLMGMVKPGGQLVIDFYEKRHWLTTLHAKYIFRPFTKRMNHERLLRLIERNAGWLIRFYHLLQSMHLGILTRFLPICDIKNTLPKGLKEDTLKEWVILDTFDMFSPAHDHPQSLKTVTEWVSKEMKVEFSGHVKLDAGQAAVVRAIKK